MTCRGPVPIIIQEHLAGRTKSGRGPARGPRLARGCCRGLPNILHVSLSLVVCGMSIRLKHAQTEMSLSQVTLGVFRVVCSLQ